MSRRAAAESARQTTNAVLGVLTLAVLGVLGWQIATQVQVSRVADRLQCLPNATFQNMTVATFQSIQNISSPASAYYAGSSGMDNTTGAFFVTVILNGQTSYSGATIATCGIYFSMTTTFVGDGVTPTYVIIDVANLHGLPFVLGPNPFNFLQLPIFSIGETDGQPPSFAFLVNGPSFTLAPVSDTQFAVYFTPQNGAPMQRYTSSFLEFAFGDYFPFTISM